MWHSPIPRSGCSRRLAAIPVLEVPALGADGTLQPEPFYHVMGYASGAGGHRDPRPGIAATSGERGPAGREWRR